MFKKLEAWLRRIIAEVVTNAIRAERISRGDVHDILEHVLVGAIHGFRAEVAKIHAEEQSASTKMHSEALSALTGATSEILAEKNRLIADLHEKATDLQQSLSRFTQWTADEDTKKTDKLHQQVER